MKYLKMILEAMISIFVSWFLAYMMYLVMLHFFGIVIPIPWVLLIAIIFSILIDVEVE